MTIEEMSAELEAAGWYWRDTGNHRHWNTCVIWQKGNVMIKCESTNTLSRQEFEQKKKDVFHQATKEAYEHLQKENEFKAMKSLLEYLRQRGIDTNANSKFDDRLRWWAGGIADTINEKMGWEKE